MKKHVNLHIGIISANSNSNPVWRAPIRPVISLYDKDEFDGG